MTDTSIKPKPTAKNDALLWAIFRQRPVKWSFEGVPYGGEIKNTADLIFKGDDKDMVISFGYEVERAGRGTRLVLSANIFETDERRKHTQIGRLIAKMKRKRRASEKYPIVDFKRTAEGYITDNYQSDIEDALKSADLIRDLKRISFNSNDEKINEVLRMAQGKIVEAWACHEKELQKTEKPKAKKSGIGEVFLNKYHVSDFKEPR